MYTYVRICMPYKNTHSSSPFIRTGYFECIQVYFTCIRSLYLHRYLEVYGNPLGCVQVPDSVTDFDSSTQWNENNETARCGDNSPDRCSVCACVLVYVYVHTCMSVSAYM